MLNTNRNAMSWSAAAVLLALAAPAAAEAQAVMTAPAPTGGLGPEQALALSARLDALERRNESLEQELKALKSQLAADRPAPTPAPPEAAGASLAAARPTLATPDGRFRAAFRGALHVDAGLYDQRRPGPLATDFRRGSLGDAGEADHARDLSDGANIRRARLGMEGTAFGDWNYYFLYDFGGSGVEEAGRIHTAWMEYAGLPVRIRAGAMAAPVGMDDVTSSNASLFFERSAPTERARALAAGSGRAGLALLANGQRWTASAAVTGNPVGVQTFGDQVGFVGRLTWLPVKGPDRLIHLGVNGSLVTDPAATTLDVAPGAVRPVRLRERPEVRLDGTRLVDTGSIDAEGVRHWGVELAGQLRNLHLQAEWMGIHVRRRDSLLADPDFSGWYLQGAWTLTGQPRRYQAATGAFDAPRGDKPFNPRTGDWGVWELAARLSDLDLNYRAGAPGSAPDASAVRGGEQQIVTLGLNWYPNTAVRLQADFQRVDVDRLSMGGGAFGAGVLTPPAGAQIGQRFNVWSLRTQYAF